MPLTESEAWDRLAFALKWGRNGEMEKDSVARANHGCKYDSMAMSVSSEYAR